MKQRSKSLEAKRAHQPIKVYVLPDEAAAIRENADSAGMSASRFLSEIGRGYSPKAIFDKEVVSDLIRLNASQARFGNLMKLWLADDVRLQKMNSVQMQAAIEAALQKAREIQDELLEKVKRLT